MPADAAPAAGSQANAVGILQPSESAGPGILGGGRVTAAAAEAEAAMPAVAATEAEAADLRH